MGTQGRGAHAILIAGFLYGFSALAAADQTPGWHLLRTANPRGGLDLVAMSHTADMARSDLQLAGLLLRCHDAGVEVAIVVVSPFSPHAQPSVTIGADGQEWHFETRVLSPGAELLLPPEAANLAAGPWQSAHKLSVKVSSQEQSFAGIIPIDGLTAALATLAASCPVGPAETTK